MCYTPSLDMRWLLVIMLSLLATAVSLPSYAAGPKKHRVMKGQTLGKIARRYNVTAKAICAANAIERCSRIKVGVRLWIPPRDDLDGSRTRLLREGAQARAATSKAARSKTKASTKQPKVRWHRVAPKQRLGSIAKRYNVTLDAIRHANDIGPKSVIRVGQKLIIPGRADLDGSEARATRLRLAPEVAATASPEASGSKKKTDAKSSWAKYQKKPKRRGWVKLVGRKGRRWQGRVITKSGRVTKAAKKAFKRVLATRGGDAHAMDARLIELVARVSDTFGGRELRVVSGYRLGTTSQTSRHRQGQAIDFVVVGVPNAVLRDYVKTFESVGVGYYPNSHFVHLDVRKQWTYWVDHSKPGQPAQYGGFWTRRSR